MARPDCLRLGFMLLPVWCMLLGVAPGCLKTVGPDNPSFAVTPDEANALLKEMRESPASLKRPLLILGGYADQGIIAGQRAAFVRSLTGDDRVYARTFQFNTSFEGARSRVIQLIEKHDPSDDPDWTVEVDVVGLSMGGLVGRYAAAPLREGRTRRALGGMYETKRLRIARLFTIGTPHRGTPMGYTLPLDPVVRSMWPNSELIQYLDAQYPGSAYELVPYTLLQDGIAFPPNTAPPGEAPHWLPHRMPSTPHHAGFYDPRIWADILLQLRGDPAIHDDDRAPLPH